MQITAVLHFSNFHYIWILLINLATKKRLLLVRKVIRSLEGFGWPLFLSDKHALFNATRLSGDTKFGGERFSALKST